MEQKYQVTLVNLSVFADKNMVSLQDDVADIPIFC